MDNTWKMELTNHDGMVWIGYDSDNPILTNRKICCSVEDTEFLLLRINSYEAMKRALEDIGEDIDEAKKNGYSPDYNWYSDLIRTTLMLSNGEA
jgi:DNA-directed RNA polymerase subunit L